MKRNRKQIKSETNSSVWRKLWKDSQASCGFCPWHRNENARRHDQAWKSWKRYRNKQWKVLES